MRPLSMETFVNTRMRSAVTPMATIASTSPTPATRCRRAASVDVILKTIACYVGGEGTVAINLSGFPIETDGYHTHVTAVSSCDGHGIDPDGSRIGQTLRSGCRIRVILLGESRLNKARQVNLIPTVKPQRFRPLNHDLCGSKVFSRHLHGEKAGGK